jgi:DNA-binding SARP family transcriptional activator
MNEVHKLDGSDFPAVAIQAKFLGGFSIWANGCSVNGLATQKNKALAAYLILEHERDHSRSKLAALFWPDVGEQAALHNLRQALSVIRKAFEPCGGGEIFTSNRETVGFRAGTKIIVDVIDFENLMRGIIDRFHQQVGRGFPILKLKRELEGYKGELLESIVLADASMFSDWLALRREALNRLAVEGASLLLKYYENRHDWSEARRSAEMLVKLAPWDENAHSRLIDVLLQLAQGNAALAHYQSAVRYFAEELAIEPEYQMKKSYVDIQRFFESRRSEPHVRMPVVKVPGYSTPFIGRAKELEILEDWVSDPGCQVITITGPGGSGKTRLVSRLAESQNTLFTGGVFFVSIADCCGTVQLRSKILNTVSIAGEKSADPMEELKSWAKNRSALLILDNVDDCGEAADLVMKILEVSGQMVIVCTSYSRLNLIGERVYPLEGLSTRGAADSEAVKLFLSHIQPESQPESKTPEFMQNIVHICELVEGLPLAIDLAAGQTKHLPSEDLLTSLKKTMDILHSSAVNLPEKHRSLTTAFENCWKQLLDRQKTMLADLTVFHSPFTQQAAAVVCNVNPPDLMELVNQSLLIWDGQERFRFHRAIHQYARGKLVLKENLSEELIRKHANFFHQQLKDGYTGFSGEGILKFLEKTKAVRLDILQAFRYLIQTKEWKKLEEIIHPLYCFYDGLSLFREGSTDFMEFISLINNADGGEFCRAMVSSRAASLLISIQQFAIVPEMIDYAVTQVRSSGNRAEESLCYNVLAKEAATTKSSSLSLEYAKKALALSQNEGDQREEAHSLFNLGYALSNLGEITKAEQVLEDCRKICKELQDWRRLSKVLNILADIACNRGNYDQALGNYGEAFKIAERMENLYSQSLVLNNIGTVYFSTKKYDAAEASYEESLRICREIEDREGEAIALSNLGELFAETRYFKKGIVYNQQALAISREISSDWGEMSARVILAICYHELGDIQAAKDELILVLERSLESEFIYFFNRAVVEACRILVEAGKTEGMGRVISEITRDEESDDWVRDRAKEVLESLPQKERIDREVKTDRESILEFLRKALLQR